MQQLVVAMDALAEEDTDETAPWIHIIFKEAGDVELPDSPRLLECGHCRLKFGDPPPLGSITTCPYCQELLHVNCVRPHCLRAHPRRPLPPFAVHNPEEDIRSCTEAVYGARAVPAPSAARHGVWLSWSSWSSCLLAS